MNRADKRRQRKLSGKAAKKKVGKKSDKCQLDPRRNQNTQQALDLAMRHHSAGDLPKAGDICQRILSAEPNQPVALHLLGVIAHQVGDNVKAVEFIAKAIRNKRWATLA